MKEDYPPTQQKNNSDGQRTKRNVLKKQHKKNK